MSEVREKELRQLRDLIEACPVLSSYQKDLLVQMDVEGKTVTQVAKDLDKAKSTVSGQHANAFQKFTDWRREPAIKEKSKDFDAEVFQLFNKGWPPNKVIEKLGHAEQVFKLWKMYLEYTQSDYSLSLKKIEEYGFEPDQDSKHPLLKQLENLYGAYWLLADEKRLIWDCLKHKEFVVEGIEEDTCESAYDAVKRLNQAFDIVVERAATYKAALESETEK